MPSPPDEPLENHPETLSDTSQMSPQHLDEFATSLDNQGCLVGLEGDLDGALRYFSQSKTIHERLVAIDPTNGVWQRHLSYSCYLIATRVFLPKGLWPEGLELVEQGLGISQRLMAIDPTNEIWQDDAQVGEALVLLFQARIKGG